MLQQYMDVALYATTYVYMDLRQYIVDLLAFVLCLKRNTVGLMSLQRSVPPAVTLGTSRPRIGAIRPSLGVRLPQLRANLLLKSFLWPRLLHIDVADTQVPRAHLL